MATDAKILQMVKDNLHITYTLDDSSARRLDNYIAAGIAYVRSRSDPRATFEPGSDGATLLCEYVLRAESGALESFKRDYAPDMLSGQLGHQADQYAEAMGYVEN